MERSEALRKLAERWKEQGIAGAPPTLWDLALALAAADVAGNEDESVAGAEDHKDPPKAE